MGGQTSSTPQISASPMSMPATPPVPMQTNMPLAAMFMGNSGYGGGYQQTPVPQIQAPAYPTPAWTPQQAQAQTVASMNALRPPVVASTTQAPQMPQYNSFISRHSGDFNVDGTGPGTTKHLVSDYPQLKTQF
ncbi:MULTISPECIES: hypothetical protein [unclassified Mesorhizobium]|uniref:hypothetical protein n=1 Tax=unclassified Mesorhizobium TaxID=325217 RepID=UPI000FC9FA33|nr:MULTISPECIES: hypothetical protein [unclassified Mesorhizobium]TGP26104.1 hypothetical protein EN875_034230 [Mesorhizobium sp. M2D.F.Ca.ET.232.01.1.1]TGQ24102.1 hypothetical protein EN863_063715 [Mesorhizobium sp. M00.F.Ca.ET.220.01.1.1]TGT95958.1 hypothetical protein EN806_53450 [bacterium M00.F.Ca.ET.163.01.1.1]